MVSFEGLGFLFVFHSN